MSYILEALRKAEQERALGRVPDLNASHTLGSPTQRRLWPWLVGFALLANAAVLAGVWLLPRSGTPSAEAPEAQALPAPAAQAPAEPVAESGDSKPPGPGTPRIAKPAPAAAPEPASPEPSSDEQAMRPRPRVATLPPVLDTPPGEPPSSVPALNLDIHVYSKLRGQRFVVINSRRYQEGDRLREGPVLESITRDGAVLRYEGRRFRLAVAR